MRSLLARIKMEVNDSLFLKDPDSSELGKRIVSHSIEMIEELGFEQFTFRKLAVAAKTTEASVYRYFENKHKLLLYLTSWYWVWTEYRMVFQTANIPQPEDRLVRALEILTTPVEEDSSFNHINEIKLDRIVISESSKAYLTKEVDQERKSGAFVAYRNVVERISELVKTMNPDYQYPHMLVSTVIEGAHQMRYFANHLPGLTDRVGDCVPVTEFYVDLVLNTLKTK